MGQYYRVWEAKTKHIPDSLQALEQVILDNRNFSPLEQLNYGDYGLQAAMKTMKDAISQKKRIALYSDYDVDGTMSCVSWIWFLQALGYENFIHYIPCRFREGYGVNLAAVKHLIDDRGAQLIITMDTGITANEEAAYARSRGVDFICTDHHKIQPQAMPDCVILNPKMHPEEPYQELCGCGITFVLLRKLAQEFSVPHSLWQDLLALTGMATICDVVPLNGVNHRLARLGVAALKRSQRPVLRSLLQACQVTDGVDETDVGFRLGPRINAVGRLEHADLIIQAFVHEDPQPLIAVMDSCNEKRRTIQQQILTEALTLAKSQSDSDFLFLGGDWHPGVVGIAASRLAEEFWRPVWLYQRQEDLCKGSARSIPGFDVSEAMFSCQQDFIKCGGHSAAGGFTFATKNEDKLRHALANYIRDVKSKSPRIWDSKITYDCDLPASLLTLDLTSKLDALKPFGHGFDEPRFCVQAAIDKINFYKDKNTGRPKHTAIFLRDSHGLPQKVMFFNQVADMLKPGQKGRFLVTAQKNFFRNRYSLSLIGHDFELQSDPSHVDFH